MCCTLWLHMQFSLIKKICICKLKHATLFFFFFKSAVNDQHLIKALDMHFLSKISEKPNQKYND